MRIFVADDQRTELGQREPERNLPLEHATFARLVALGRAFAGDHQRDAHAVGLRAPQEVQQRGVRLRLSEAV